MSDNPQAVDNPQAGAAKPKDGAANVPTVRPDQEVVKTVIDSYYSRGVAAADRARDGSEKGYTIAGAIAAALVATGLLTNLDKRPELVQVLVLSAVGIWLVAVMLFIWAVAVPVTSAETRDPDAAGWSSEADFVQGVGKEVKDELNQLRKRQKAAIFTTVLAVGLTVAALIAGTADPGGASPEKARIALTRQGDVALRRICGSSVADIYATVNPDDLANEVVPLNLPAGECGATVTTIHEPRSAIVAEEKIIRFPRFP